MPNYCFTKVTITGPANEVAAFVVRAKGVSPLHRPRREDLDFWSKKVEISELSFQQIAPIDRYKLGRDYDAVGFVAEVEAWGIKWGRCVWQLKGASLEW